MKIEEIRALSEEEITSRINTWEEERFRARCEHAVGQLNNPILLRHLRKDIARAKTILNEKKKHGASE